MGDETKMKGYVGLAVVVLMALSCDGAMDMLSPVALDDAPSSVHGTTANFDSVSKQVEKAAQVAKSEAEKAQEAERSIAKAKVEKAKAQEKKDSDSAKQEIVDASKEVQHAK